MTSGLADVTSIPAIEHPTPATLVRLAIAFSFCAAAGTCGVWSALINWEIMEKVNSRLPESERFRPLRWGPFKWARLKNEYRRLFPDGEDLKRIYRLTAIMFVTLAGFLISLRFLF